MENEKEEKKEEAEKRQERRRLHSPMGWGHDEDSDLDREE